jgi:SAM-dependent methyltransferase
MMSDDLNPQQEQMAHASMIETLAMQAQAVWPQEQTYLKRYTLPPDIRILDVGCGTGEFATRIAELLPSSQILGIDILPEQLERARLRSTAFGNRIEYRLDDAYQISQPDHSYDLTTCRHMLQSVPHPERIIKEMIRVTRPGGRLHIIAEDYGMVHFHPTQLENDRFWREGPVQFGSSTGSDMRFGCRAFTLLKALNLQDITVDYLIVDTLRVDRDIIARLWEAWRVGYTDALAQHSSFSRDDIEAHWEDMLTCIRNPNGYMVWLIPLVSGIIGVE